MIHTQTHTKKSVKCIFCRHQHIKCVCVNDFEYRNIFYLFCYREHRLHSAHMVIVAVLSSILWFNFFCMHSDLLQHVIVDNKSNSYGGGGCGSSSANRHEDLAQLPKLWCAVRSDHLHNIIKYSGCCNKSNNKANDKQNILQYNLNLFYSYSHRWLLLSIRHIYGRCNTCRDYPMDR